MRLLSTTILGFGKASAERRCRQQDGHEETANKSGVLQSRRRRRRPFATTYVPVDSPHVDCGGRVGWRSWTALQAIDCRLILNRTPRPNQLNRHRPSTLSHTICVHRSRVGIREFVNGPAGLWHAKVKSKLNVSSVGHSGADALQHVNVEAAWQ